MIYRGCFLGLLTKIAFGGTDNQLLNQGSQRRF
jgi:hypothetical protein